MGSARRVLVVDESEESRQVLCALLARNGAEPLEAEQAEQAADLTCRFQPDVIVFDAESDHTARHEATERLGSVAGIYDIPLSLLGTTPRHTRDVACQFVHKPYHYGPLIRRIEQLLAG